jgi:hypothetical protein
MDIKLKYRKIFLDLFDSEKGLFAYTLYSRYAVQPSEAIDFIDIYKKDGIISIDEEQRIKLTAKGRGKINVILNKLVPKQREKASYISELKLKESIGIFEPYLPDIQFYERYRKEKSERETSI